MLLCWCVPPADGLQVSRGFLPVQHPGKLFLAAGGGHVPADPARPDVRVAEEVLLVVHFDWMGWARTDGEDRRCRIECKIFVTHKPGGSAPTSLLSSRSVMRLPLLFPLLLGIYLKNLFQILFKQQLQLHFRFCFLPRYLLPGASRGPLNRLPSHSSWVPSCFWPHFFCSSVSNLNASYITTKKPSQHDAKIVPSCFYNQQRSQRRVLTSRKDSKFIVLKTILTMIEQWITFI